MTQPFVDFAFPTIDADTASTPRTMPVRLADIHNVKDFGAVGDGVTDDWEAVRACLNWKTYFIQADASNLVATLTGAVSNATFTGTISGNNLTTSGVTGTLAIGHTIRDYIASFTPCKILTGSGSSWTVDGSPQTVGPIDMVTDSILTASSISTSVTVGDYLINNGGTDASPSTLTFGTKIISSKGSGVYGVTQFLDDSNQHIILGNFTSQAMKTVSSTISLSTPVASTLGQGAYDADNATFCGDGESANGGLPFLSSSSTITILTGVGGIVSFGDRIGFQYPTKGEIYFPPGTYYVSKPIDYTAGGATVYWNGGPGVTLLGNFDDYVLKQRGLPGSGVSATLTRVEKFNVINLHATGGGIRCAGSSSGGVFDCTVTANKGISLYNNDAREAGSYFGAFDYSIENCSVNAGANYSGSFGIASPSDGPITNCRVIGYEWGFLTAGGEGAQVLLGCYFEKCGTAIALGRAPDAGTFSASGVVVAGCWIKDCGIGFNAFASTSLATVIGLRIEGTNGQAPGGTNPQYGIYKGMSYSMLAGITIVGQFDVAGLYMAGVPFFINGPNLIGVSDSATSPNPFDLDASGGNGFIATQIACSAKHIYTVATIPDPVTGITDPGLFTGQQVNVSDGTNGLNWGDTLTGTGTHTTHYAAQWNGSAWTVLGK